MNNNYFIPKNSDNIIIFDKKDMLPRKRMYTNNIIKILKLENISEYLEQDIKSLNKEYNRYNKKYKKHNKIKRISRKLSFFSLILIIPIILFNHTIGIELNHILIPIISLFGVTSATCIIYDDTKIKNKMMEINNLINIETKERERVLTSINKLSKDKNATNRKNEHTDTIVTINVNKQIHKEEERINTLYNKEYNNTKIKKRVKNI